MDIIILLLCTFFIINRLIKILGQYDTDQARKEKNSIIMDLFKQRYNIEPSEKIINPEVLSAAELKLPDNIRSVFEEIRKQDNQFDFDRFINGIKKAYTMYIKAKSDCDQDTLRNLVDVEVLNSIKMQNDGFKKIDSVSEVNQVTVKDAVLFGDRAMITVEIQSKEIHYIEDNNKNLISGSKDNPTQKIINITFCRYLTQEKIWKIIRVQ